MAKELHKVVKLQVKGGAANPSPPVGPALGGLLELTLWSSVSNLMLVHRTSLVKYYLLLSLFTKINLLICNQDPSCGSSTLGSSQN